jgi:hypothetical protein
MTEPLTRQQVKAAGTPPLPQCARAPCHNREYRRTGADPRSTRAALRPQLAGGCGAAPSNCVLARSQNGAHPRPRQQALLMRILARDQPRAPAPCRQHASCFLQFSCGKKLAHAARPLRCRFSPAVQLGTNSPACARRIHLRLASSPTSASLSAPCPPSPMQFCPRCSALVQTAAPARCSFPPLRCIFPPLLSFGTNSRPRALAASPLCSACSRPLAADAQLPPPLLSGVCCRPGASPCTRGARLRWRARQVRVRAGVRCRTAHAHETMRWGGGIAAKWRTRRDHSQRRCTKKSRV